MKKNVNGLDRRQFLIVSSTCAVGTAVLGPTLFGSEDAARRVPLSIGFAELDAPAAADGSRFASNVMSAERLSSSDGGFISRGARVRLTGVGGGLDPRNRRSVELIAHFSVQDGDVRRMVPFRAWGYSRKTGSEGSPTSFYVPIDEEQQLNFSVLTEQPNEHAAAAARAVRIEPGPDESLNVTLTLLSQPGKIKLQRGYYIIAPQYDNHVPSWSSVQLRNEGRRSVLAASNGIETGPAPFEHFILRVDYQEEKTIAE